MTVSKNDETANDKLTAAQRANLEKMNKHRAEILEGFNEVLSKFEIDLKAHSYTSNGKSVTMDAPPHMVCCNCPPPEYAPAGSCSPCPEGGVGPGPVALES